MKWAALIAATLVSCGGELPPIEYSSEPVAMVFYCMGEPVGSGLHYAETACVR